MGEQLLEEKKKCCVLDSACAVCRREPSRELGPALTNLICSVFILGVGDRMDGLSSGPLHQSRDSCVEQLLDRSYCGDKGAEPLGEQLLTQGPARAQRCPCVQHQPGSWRGEQAAEATGEVRHCITEKINRRKLNQELARGDEAGGFAALCCDPVGPPLAGAKGPGLIHPGSTRSLLLRVQRRKGRGSHDS